jgi:chromate transporter
LFRTFLQIAFQSFGGAMVPTHRLVVEKRRWLNDQEFAETFGICQILPGANAINVAVMVGARLRGARGAAVAATALVLPPMLLLLVVGALYDRYGDLALVRSALVGVSVAAPGMLVALGLKLTVRYRRSPVAIVFIAAGFSALAILRLPLVVALLVLAPFAVAASRRGWQ